jgi:hypothetical protein
MTCGFFVGWVEPTPYFVGFRDTQSNLRSNVVLPKAKPNNSDLKSEHERVSFIDQSGCFSGKQSD